MRGIAYLAICCIVMFCAISEGAADDTYYARCNLKVLKGIILPG